MVLGYSDVDKPNIVYNEFLKVEKFEGHSVIVEKPLNYDYSNSYDIKKFGFAKKNKQGRQSSNRNSIFYKGGIKLLRQLVKMNL